MKVKKKVNKNVSISGTTRAERIIINELKVLTNNTGKVCKRGRKASIAWTFFGALYHMHDQYGDNGTADVGEKNLVYCRWVWTINLNFIHLTMQYNYNRIPN
jgi:hypothetical protein